MTPEQLSSFRVAGGAGAVVLMCECTWWLMWEPDDPTPTLGDVAAAADRHLAENWPHNPYGPQVGRAPRPVV